MAAAMLVGPATKPSNPNTSKPPNTPMNNNNSFNRVRFRSSNGRIILSATPATPPQIIRMVNPLPQCPLTARNSAAGTQIKADPTTGTSEKNPITTAQKIGDEIPPMVNPNPPNTPGKQAITNPPATLAKIRSFDSSSTSLWIASSNGSKCRTPRTTLSPSRNMKNNEKIKINKSIKNVTRFFNSFPKFPARNEATRSAACRKGCEKSHDCQSAGKCARTQVIACIGKLRSGSVSAS